MNPTERIHAFDWLRGFSVLLMIQSHALVLLLPHLRAGVLYERLRLIDGLVAPAFLFSAGFALALVQIREGARGRGAAQIHKSLKRIGQVLLLASLINVIWFPVFREPKWLFRIDILHCIGLSLLLALPLIIALARRPWLLSGSSLALSFVLFAVAPLTEGITGLAQLILSHHPGALDDTTGAVFPLVPWAGYVFLGVSFGTTVATMRSEKVLWRWIGALVAIGLILVSQEQAVEAIYPAHDFWATNPVNAAWRWTGVLIIVALFRWVERTWPLSVHKPIASALGQFGAASLSAYFFHEMLLLQENIGFFGLLFRDKADWPLYWVLVVGLIAATWVCVKLWNPGPRTNAFSNPLKFDHFLGSR